MVRLLACAGASGRVCVCVRAHVHVLRIVSRVKILCFKNTLIIITPFSFIPRRKHRKIIDL